MSALADLKELIQRRAIVRHFVSAELKSGNRDKVLGSLWQLIDPLTFMLVFYVIWSLILGTRGPDFMGYLLSGIITFNFFQDTVIGCSTILRNQVRLIREVYFPKSVLPTAFAVARLYDFAWALGALVLVLVYLLYVQSYMQSHMDPDAFMKKIVHPLSFGINVIWLPLCIGLLVMFTLGAAYLSAIIGAVFRDTPNILTFTFRIWFYLSPLFYYPEEARHRMPELWFFIRINPFAHFFRLLRNSLIYNEPPTLDGTLYIAALSVVTLVVGFVVFARYESTVIKQL